jgi:hypothetical protein
MRRFNLPNLIAPPKTPRNRGEKLNIQNPKSNITLIDLGGLCVSNSLLKLTLIKVVAIYHHGKNSSSVP